MTATIAVLCVFAGAATTADAKCGNKLCLDTTHTPDFDPNTTTDDFIIPNGYLNYRVEVTNPGAATATKVVLSFTLDSRVKLISSPPGCTQPPATQPPPPLITCSLGSVKPTNGTPIPFAFVVQMPQGETDGTPANPHITSVASITADARSSDTGNNPNDPTSETFSDDAEVVAVDLRDGQSASAVLDGVAPIVLNTDADGSGPTDKDVRTAVFRLRTLGFSTTAAISDSVPDQTFLCPAKLKCPSGGWTDATIPGPPNPLAVFDLFEVELNYDATTVPSGLTEKGYVMLHLTNSGVLEQISRSCSSNPAPCLESVELKKNGDLKAVALVTGNHRFR